MFFALDHINNAVWVPIPIRGIKSLLAMTLKSDKSTKTTGAIVKVPKVCYNKSSKCSILADAIFSRPMTYI